MSITKNGSFFNDRRGSISVITAVTMVPFIIAVGTAVEMGWANRTISHMQKAADSAALAAAGTFREIEIAGGDTLSGEEAKIYAAQMMVEANLPDQIKPMAEDPDVIIDGTKASVGLEVEMETMFMKFVGIDTMSLSVTAVADADVNAHGCVVALGPEGKGIEIGGTVDLEVDGCWLYSNKKGSKSIDLIGGAEVDIQGSCSAGTTSVSNNATLNVDEQQLSGCPPIDDPKAAWTHPTIPAGCTFNKFKKSAGGGSKDLTLTPGVYCGGLQLSGYDQVVLAPGIYYIKDGPLTINSQADVTGEGIGFYLANDVTSVTINGGADMALTAPDDGIMDGMLIAMEPGADSLIAAKINGGADLNLTGTIYLPQGELNISGNSATLSSAMQIIADSVKLSGTSSLSFTAQPDEDGNPLGDAFVSLVRLIK